MKSPVSEDKPVWIIEVDPYRRPDMYHAVRIPSMKDEWDSKYYFTTGQRAMEFIRLSFEAQRQGKEIQA